MTKRETTNGSLFLVDGSALAYRSHFAFIRNPLVTSRGENVSALFGFTSALLRLRETGLASHLAVVFDTPEKTFRHERYPDYKATREKMPEELVEQLPALDELIEAFRIPCLRLPGFEADDVIGTLARRGEAEGMDVFIVSGDKDFLQLVTDHVQMYSLGKANETGQALGDEHAREKFGVPANRIIDLLALMGDSSDNVPGVPRVGAKTAAALLQEFDSLDGVYQHLEDIKKPALRKNLTEHRDLAELSRELVTIHTDVPLDHDVGSLVLQDPDRSTLERLFLQYEFQSLLGRIPGPAGAAVDEEHRYHLVNTLPELEALAARLREKDFFVFDTETTGLDPLRADLVGLSVCIEPGEAWYVPTRAPEGLFGSTGNSLDRERVREVLGPVFADPKVGKGGQNAKYDWHVLERAGWTIQGLTFDTMVAHYCVAPSAMSHSLDALSLEYFQYTKIPTKDLLGRGKSQITMAEVPVDQVCEYACEDADYTLRLKQVLEKQLVEHQVEDLFHQLEVPLIDVLRRMERAGVALDTAALGAMSERFEERSSQLVEEIHEHAGEPFNVNSTKQLGEILFEKLELHKASGLNKAPRTKTGYSTSAETLSRLADHPLVSSLLEYRQIEKLRSTYVDALPRLVNPDTGRVHTSFNQAVAATGRLSSSDPNLQNIPIRTPLGREIRRAFTSSFSDGTLISADYSQVELRILAHLSGDRHLREAFENQEDIHQRTAALVFGLEPDQVDAGLRSRAKAINFGILYGMGPQRLARETGLDLDAAKQFIERYFEVFADVKGFLDHTLEEARQRGYTTTLLGRRREIPELNSENRGMRANAENMAVNTPIQGTAADLIKRAMIRVDQALSSSDLTSRMILQVHDELVFDVAPGESQAVTALAREGMEGALDLCVPLKVDVGEGPTWLDAH